LESLGSQKSFLNGIVWTLVERLGVQGTSFLVNIILTRLLLPAQFGLIGMIAVFMAIGHALIDSGLTSSLIRTKNPDQTDYSTVFFINLIGSLVVYGLIFLFAPVISSFYEQPVLVNLIRVYSLGFIVNAFASIQQTRLTKELKFKTQMQIRIPSTVMSGIVGIYLASNGWGVWSLVYMYLTNTILASVQFWFYSKWTPTFEFNLKRFIYHFSYGYKLTISGLLNSIFSNVYHVVIGKLYSPVSLGYYTRAMMLQQQPVLNLSSALNKVTFPHFAAIQDNVITLRAAYKKIMQQVVFIIAPVMAIAIVLAEPLIVFLFTDKWLPSVPYFQLMCLIGVIYPLQSYNLNILKVFGRSELFLRLEVLKKSLTVLMLLVTFRFGISAIVLGQVINAYFSFVINSYYSGRFINYSTWDQIKNILPIFFISAIVGIMVYLFDLHIVGSQVSWVRLIGASSLGVLLYIVLMHFFKIAPYLEMTSFLKRKFKIKI
jgi:teichuronic acid exporter